MSVAICLGAVAGPVVRAPFNPELLEGGGGIFPVEIALIAALSASATALASS